MFRFVKGMNMPLEKERKKIYKRKEKEI